MRLVRLTTIALLLLSTTVLSAGAGSRLSGRGNLIAEDPINLVEKDYQDGLITKDRRAVLQITAIKWPDRLPDKYLPLLDKSDQFFSRAATPAIVEIMTNWDEYSPQTQAFVSAALARKSVPFSYVSPSGFFRLHYDTTGIDAVSAVDSDGNGVPDYIDRAAAHLDTSLTYHITLGYLLPPADNGAGGDDLYDVYFENMSFYGYAVPDGQGTEAWNDYYSYIVMHRNFINFPPNTDPEGNPEGASKATAAHEFHHSVQFAYDATEFIWFMEMDATYMEDIAFNHVNDNYNYLPTYMNNPSITLMQTSLHMYASFIYGLYLAQQFDTSLMVALWEGARFTGTNVFQSLSDTLVGRYGWTQDSAFAEFVMWNYATASRDDGLHHTEASSYPSPAFSRSHTGYPVSLNTSPLSPGGYSASYIQMLPGSVTGQVRINFDGADGSQWAAFLIKSTAINSHQYVQIPLNPADQSGSLDIADVESYQSLTLVGINLSEFGAPASFSYSAFSPSLFNVTSTVISTDSVVYSGGLRLFDYEVTNPAPIGDVYDIFAWDVSGWISTDVVDLFLAPQTSAVISFAVTPPAGTPLSELSTLHFIARSKSDPLVFDEQTAVAMTVLQRGDVDFDGKVDIADLTYLIDFLFINFDPSPQPVVISGDVSCDGTAVDIVDLTALIDLLFINFTPVSCNPY